jgi:TRAP-type C4-dicarboxylate transport system permease small subunit
MEKAIKSLARPLKWLAGHPVEVLAGAFLLLFAGVWGWIGFELWNFTATKEEPTLTFDEVQLGFAGFLASAVGAGTASVLGFEIQKKPDAPVTEESLGTRVAKASSDSPLLPIGGFVYLVVGIAVASGFFFRSDIAPEVVSTFSWGVLGWLAGAFAAVFKAKTS